MPFIVYQVLFFTGLVFTVVTFLLGRFGGAHDHGGADCSDVHGADVHGIDMHGTDVHGVELHGDLHGVELHGDLHGAELHGDLHGAGMDANSVETDVSGADVHGAGLAHDVGYQGIHVTGLDHHADPSSGAHMHHDGSPLAGIGAALLPFKVSCMVLWITVMGGMGMLMTNAAYIPWLTFLTSLFSGYIAAVLFNGGVLIPLSKSQNTSAAMPDELIGREALVNSAILENGYGRIRYVVRGNTYNAPAKHATGKRVEQGETVVIREIRGGTYLVTRPMEPSKVSPQEPFL